MTESMHDQWRTECPDCGGDLRVVRVDPLGGNRGQLHVDIPLSSDGFYIEGCDGGTENEVVVCASCNIEYWLSDLELGTPAFEVRRRKETEAKYIGRTGRFRRFRSAITAALRLEAGSKDTQPHTRRLLKEVADKVEVAEKFEDIALKIEDGYIIEIVLRALASHIR